MITLKTGQYSDQNLVTLRDALDAALHNVQCITMFGKPDCDHCENKRPCRDIQSAIRHLDNIINSNKESMNNETV